MAMPSGIGVVDLMIGFPSANMKRYYEFMQSQFRDDESKTMNFPAEYMFKDVPKGIEEDIDPVEVTLSEMDRFGIEIGLVGLGGKSASRAIEKYPDRFRATLEVDPNEITKTVREIRDAHDEHRIVAVTSFPAGCSPQVPVSDRRYYPIYQACIDLDIPVVLNAGVAGPRLPTACQDVIHFDQVCYDFPELRIVMRHGAEPWEELAVKLMLKWPGLYYMTSAFAPRYYPEAIVNYANTRGADKIMYAGYYPMGLSLDRIFRELADVTFRDHVWPKFLRENAFRVFKLDEKGKS